MSPTRLPDPVDPGAPGPPDPRVPRRRFVQALASDAVTWAATLTGVREAIRDASAGLLDAVRQDALAGAAGPLPGVPAGGVPTDSGHRGTAAPFRLADGRLLLLDQRRLPHHCVEYPCRDAADVSQAIRDRVVTGVSVLGQVAAWGVALGVARAGDVDPRSLRAAMYGSVNTLRNVRPTNACVTSALDRMVACYEANVTEPDATTISRCLWDEAEALRIEAARDQTHLGESGAGLLPWRVDRPTAVIVHGAVGPLAWGGIGTALGIVLAAHREGRAVHVYVGESRPGLEGARLTTWELGESGVPHTLLSDASMGGLLASGRVDVALVAAEAIAANGDTRSTAGTYGLAAIADRHGIPFYVAAPTSIIDTARPDGSALLTGQGDPEGIITVERPEGPPIGTRVMSTSRDVIPADLVTAFVTEIGVLQPPLVPAIADSARIDAR